MKWLVPAALVALVVLVLGAHVAMLSDPDIPRDAAWRLARLNAIAWAVILLPPIGVALWLRARRRRNAGRRG
jgi:hypothetical protein